MGRRKNNPELVQELKDNLWNLGYEGFDEKYDSLSSSDRSEVAEAIADMDKEYFSDDDDEDW
ncbi:MAG: hypothetical protein Q4B77_04715 [Coriobacteriaceae bacterium]|nr:hypothetical protein [Coriobacteriaceae bacterium]